MDWFAKIKLTKGELMEFMQPKREKYATADVVQMEFPTGKKHLMTKWRANEIIAKHNRRIEETTDLVNDILIGDKLPHPNENEAEKPLKTPLKDIEDRVDDIMKGVDEKNAELLKKEIASLPKHMPTLDKWEKRYLEQALAPFKKTLVYIVKSACPITPSERLHVSMSNGQMDFPFFAEGKMYKGLHGEEIYTPEELGLWKK